MGSASKILFIQNTKNEKHGCIWYQNFLGSIGSFITAARTNSHWCQQSCPRKCKLKGVMKGSMQEDMTSSCMSACVTLAYCHLRCRLLTAVLIAYLTSLLSCFHVSFPIAIPLTIIWYLPTYLICIVSLSRTCFFNARRAASYLYHTINYFIIYPACCAALGWAGMGQAGMGQAGMG